VQKNHLPIIVKRSENGPFMKEAEFEKVLSKCTAELVKKYGLKFNPQVPVPSDDGRHVAPSDTPCGGQPHAARAAPVSR